MIHLRLDTNRPDRVTLWIDVAERSVNVLSESVFDELRQSLDLAIRQRAGVPIVLRSAKPKGFVAGADLRRILAVETDEQIQAFLRYGQECLDYLEQLPATTVALIEGPCLGGGLELALACRYRVARDIPRTHLGMPEAKLGLIPGWGGTQRLVATVGVEVGLQMLLTGDSVTAGQAYEIGLVDALGADAHWEDEVTRFLQSVKDRTIPSHQWPDVAAREQLEQWNRAHDQTLSQAQRTILEAVTAGLYGSREDGLRAERQLFFPLLMSPPTRAKLQRFTGSRPHEASESRSDDTP